MLFILAFRGRNGCISEIEARMLYRATGQPGIHRKSWVQNHQKNVNIYKSKRGKQRYIGQEKCQ